ncbi:DsbA family protein [Streptomyces tendae]|uniref:mycothiol-dependent nitroreductase Rv2466c family protein n=1 Tax=Streptomyces tendae TaxID=1932 RepID=UPI0033C3BCAF
MADIWFDVVCPWAWITSRWILEVESVRPVRARWNVMSLAILNAENEKTELYQQLMDQSLESGRILMAAASAARAAGDDPSMVLGRLYTEMGSRFHLQAQPLSSELYAEALTAAGLPADLAEVAGSDAYDEELRTSHDDAMARVGRKVGTPVVAVSGNAFFGPVITPSPRGEEAGVLWDGVMAVSRFEGFFELKRTRTRKPSFE